MCVRLGISRECIENNINISTEMISLLLGNTNNQCRYSNNAIAFTDVKHINNIFIDSPTSFDKSSLILQLFEHRFDYITPSLAEIFVFLIDDRRVR